MIDPACKVARFAQMWNIATLGRPATIVQAFHGWALLAQMRLVKPYSYHWVRARTYESVRAGFIVVHNDTPGKHTTYKVDIDKLA